MAIRGVRRRLVNIRVTEEEVAGLRKAAEAANARSVSDFCRTAILEASGGHSGSTGIDELQQRLALLEQNAGRLAKKIEEAIPEA